MSEGVRSSAGEAETWIGRNHASQTLVGVVGLHFKRRKLLLEGEGRERLFACVIGV